MTDLNDLTATPPPPSGTPGPEEKTWGMLAHLAALSGLFTLIGCVIGPLVVWLIKKDTMAFVDDQGKEALNFNITLMLVAAALWIFGLVTLGIGFVIALPLAGILAIAWLVLTIIAMLKANEGVAYRYPFALRLIK